MAQVWQKIYHLIIGLKIPLHPHQPTFGRDEIYYFFSLSFLNLRSSPHPQNLEINFLCKVVELQTQFCLPKIFLVTPPGTPQNEPPKNQFFKQLKIGRYFFFYQ